MGANSCDNTGCKLYYLFIFKFGWKYPLYCRFMDDMGVVYIYLQWCRGAVRNFGLPIYKDPSGIFAVCILPGEDIFCRDGRFFRLNSGVGE